MQPNPEKKTNRLINEKSPYLLQHAYNPVDWYPWGQEALDKAKAEDKPIFLSIGYCQLPLVPRYGRGMFRRPASCRPAKRGVCLH